MKITKKLVDETIHEAIGEDAMPIVKFLEGRKNVSEFVISEKTKVEIHRVRNVLYRLHEKNLASYKRKKDSQKGYYISYWTFNRKSIKDVVSTLQNTKLHKLKERLEHEELNEGCFFLCTNACVRMNFEQGTEVEFKCPECGNLLQQQDNSRTIEVLRDRLKEMEA